MTAPLAHPAAPLDRPTRLTTFAVAVGLLVGLPLLALTGGGAGPGAGAALGAIAAGLLLGAWCTSPAGYELDGATLRVRRRGFGARTFRLTGPARRAPAELGLGVRFGWTGGAFGWTGWFWQSGLGRYRAYMTDRARLVACPTDAGLLVVSPADPDAFVRASRQESGRAAS